MRSPNCSWTESKNTSALLKVGRLWALVKENSCTLFRRGAFNWCSSLLSATSSLQSYFPQPTGARVLGRTVRKQEKNTCWEMPALDFVPERLEENTAPRQQQRDKGGRWVRDPANETSCWPPKKRPRDLLLWAVVGLISHQNPQVHRLYTWKCS